MVEQYGFQDGPYGDANTLMRARMASEQKLKESGILEAKSGKVRLIRRQELSFDWFIKSQNLVWAIVQHLCRALDDAGGHDKCADLMAKLQGETIEQVKTLAYRIYQICDRQASLSRQGWAEEALAYNNLVASWGVLEGKTKDAKKSAPIHLELGL